MQRLVDEAVERCGDDRHPRQQRRPLRVARDAAVRADPARGVAPGDGRQRRLDVPHVPRGRAGDARGRRRQDRQHLVRARRFAACPFLLHYVTSKGAIVALTRALAKELGKDNVLVNCVAPGFTMSAGVEAHPEVVEKLRDVSVAARTLQRDQVPGGRRRRGRLPLRPRLGLRHRPDDRDRRRPELPLILAARPTIPTASRPARATTSSTTSTRDEAHVRRRRASTGRALVWELTERPAGDWLAALRPRRLPARRRRVPAHPSRARGCACCSRAASGSTRRGRRTSTARSSGGTRPAPTRSSRPRPRREETAFVRVLVLPARVGGQADDHATSIPPTRRSRSSSARASTSSTACERAHGGKLLVDQLVVHGTELAFCVPGESYLALLDGLYDAPIRLITCRHEAARRTWPRPTASSPAVPASASSRAGRARRTRRSACTPRSRTRRR